MAEKIKEDTKELEKKIIEVNMLNAQLQELEQQLQILEKQISELQLTSMALQDLQETKVDTEALAQIGQSIFVKTNLKDSKEVFVDIGSKIFAKKTVEEAQQITENKMDEFVNLRNRVAQQMQFVAQKMIEIENNLRERS